MENMSDDDGWEFVNLGDQQSFGIKTAGLEEKATACQMLVSSKAMLVMCVLLDSESEAKICNKAVLYSKVALFVWILNSKENLFYHCLKISSKKKNT